MGSPVLSNENLLHCAIAITETPYQRLIGSALVELAHRRMKAIPIVTLNEPDAIVVNRCKSLASHCAKKCTYESTMDKPLHNILRLLLPAHIEAALCDESPYDAMNRMYPGTQTNDIERPWICATPESLVNKVSPSKHAFITLRFK